MRYSFRLAELLGHSPDPRRRPGTIKSIVEHTGLDRHQVAALLKNEVKYIPLIALSRLCDYLIENGHCSAEQLPGALFSVEPENFWELLARRRGWNFASACDGPITANRSTAPGWSLPTRCCWASCSTASRRSAARRSTRAWAESKEPEIVQAPRRIPSILRNR